MEKQNKQINLETDKIPLNPKIDPKIFHSILKQEGIEFITGVPDSLLKDFCAYIQDHHPKKNHIIAANEGTAVSLAAGYHLSTNKIPLVYLQNSGLGNTINPLMSLCHEQVYSIPIILLIGWRGEPEKKDEPQHQIQGKTMQGIIEKMQLSQTILPQNSEEAKHVLQKIIKTAKNTNSPQFLIVKKDTFTPYKLQNPVQNNFPLSREKAIEIIVNSLKSDDIIVSTTGFASRELFEIREKNQQKHNQDFLTVGSMGHASSIALGIALQQKQKKVWCLDGDGAAIMHMGAMTQIGSQKPQNMIHVILNNIAHDSVGAQPTCADHLDFQLIARGCNYYQAFSVSQEQELKAKLKQFQNCTYGPLFLEIKVQTGARENLGRPTSTPIQNKTDLMDFLTSDSNQEK